VRIACKVNTNEYSVIYNIIQIFTYIYPCEYYTIDVHKRLKSLMICTYKNLIIHTKKHVGNYICDNYTSFTRRINVHS